MKEKDKLVAHESKVENIFRFWKEKRIGYFQFALTLSRPEVPWRHPNSRSASSRQILAAAWNIDVVNTPLERGEVGLNDEGRLDWHTRNGGEGGAG